MLAYRSRSLLRPILLLAITLLMASTATASTQTTGPATRPAVGKTFAIAIHGGAGTIRRRDLGPELEQQ